jgi:hypothetical protein
MQQLQQSCSLQSLRPRTIDKEEERALITHLITGRESAYVLASKASKASSKIVVKRVQMENILAQASSTQPLQSVIH